MRLIIRVFVVALALGLAAPSGVRADDPDAGITRNPSTLNDSQLDERLAFLEQSLNGSQTHAKYWQWGWTTAYASGIAIGTARAIATDDGDHRADYVTTAVKGVIGTARMVLSPHPGRAGAAPMQAVSGNSRDAKLERLRVGEKLLRDAAKRADRRKTWLPHVANVGLNLVGSAFILGFGDADDAVASFVIGATVGEAQIWSEPTRYKQDLEDYETRFVGRTSKRFDWQVVPTMGGAALQVRF